MWSWGQNNERKNTFFERFLFHSYSHIYLLNGSNIILINGGCLQIWTGYFFVNWFWYFPRNKSHQVQTSLKNCVRFDVPQNLHNVHLASLLLSFISLLFGCCSSSFSCFSKSGDLVTTKSPKIPVWSRLLSRSFSSRTLATSFITLGVYLASYNWKIVIVWQA